MKAAQLDKYSKEFKLTVRNIPVPEINADEVLVKVKAAAVNPLEKLIGMGSVKLIQDYSLPVTLGNELTGVIEKVGANVAGFKEDDAIYTRLPINQIGAFAEYVAIPATAISKLPSNLNFETGAAVSLTGLTAYQGMLEELAVEPGKTIFIAGGSGSFGQLAIPLAKSLGLKVIVSGGSRNRERSLRLGADEYVAYENKNYWDSIDNVDYVIDTLGPDEFEHELSIIKPGGRLLSLRTGPNKHFALTHHFSRIKRLLFSLAGGKYDRSAAKKDVKYRFIFVRSDGEQLSQLTKLIEEKNIVPAIDPKVFDIDHINEALDYAFTKRLQGKVIVTFDAEKTSFDK